MALRGVSLRVERGQFVAVTGPSGSGKSTLLACIAGLDEPDGGTVRIDGHTMTRQPEAARARLRGQWIGLLLQTGNLVEHLSVRANVAIAQRIAGQVNPRRLDDLLERLGLGDRTGARPSELSGGEATRAGLAVALANDPAVVLADESTGEVDAVTGARVLQLLRDCVADDRAVVVVTHSAAVAAEADRRVALHDGRVVS